MLDGDSEGMSPSHILGKSSPAQWPDMAETLTQDFPAW